MYVGRVMHTDLVTVPPNTPLGDAREIIKDKRIDHLLVVDKSKGLVGLVSDRDLKQSWASPATTLSTHELSYLLDKITVDMIMVKKIITVTPDTTIERAALIMQENRIGSLPVIDHDKKLVGIITTTNVLEVLLEALGIGTDSKRFIVLVKDRIGSIAEVARILKEQGINILSLVSWPEKNYPDVYQLVMRVPAEDDEKAISSLIKNGFPVITEYVKDHGPFIKAI
ncbi:MAG: CBS and ACT domain-containing protein [Desulfobacterales bacterium]|nr:CBS and ACT domain-containing protein [Desulfobacterales bacterium]MDD4071736.1 CBS and ACT domain-containing protein [Desulfobacterales bacterium]MDD4391697.1 CBS and ACT domain-containing protein [Desulfobacterales bacterium]